MDTISLVRLIGLGVVCVVFIATVLLMPRILGVNPPASAARRPDPVEPTTPGVRAPVPAVVPVRESRPVGASAASEALKS